MYVLETGKEDPVRVVSKKSVVSVLANPCVLDMSSRIESRSFRSHRKKVNKTILPAWRFGPRVGSLGLAWLLYRVLRNSLSFPVLPGLAPLPSRP